MKSNETNFRADSRMEKFNTFKQFYIDVVTLLYEQLINKDNCQLTNQASQFATLKITASNYFSLWILPITASNSTVQHSACADYRHAKRKQNRFLTVDANAAFFHHSILASR